MEKGMNIVNGLHEFLTDTESFVKKAKSCDVKIFDIRKPKNKKDDFTADDAEFNRAIIESLKKNEKKNENSHI